MTSPLRKVPDNPTLRGDRYRRTHADSVKAILGTLAPPVYSRGSQFYNRDRWTLRVFVEAMCKWAHLNPSSVPSRKEVGAWVGKANKFRVPHPRIVIANTPDELPHSLFQALVGGAYHEALHSLLSCRRHLTTEEMAVIVIPRWERVSNWGRFFWLLQDWANIVEDIRIEREGSRLFAGVQGKLEHLQDLIISMERRGEQDVRSHGDVEEHEEDHVLSLLASTFRDLGLGYQTETQIEALEAYKFKNEDAFDFVRNGPLSRPLQDAICLGDDDTGCVRVALDAIIAIVDASEDPPKEEQDPEPEPPTPREGDLSEPETGPEENRKEEGPDEDSPSSDLGQEKVPGEDIGDPEEKKPQESRDWKPVAAAATEEAGETNGLGLYDNNSGLGSSFKDLDPGGDDDKYERPYSPYSPVDDLVLSVSASKAGKGVDVLLVDEWLREVSQDCSYLRARLATKVRALEMTSVFHGSRHGTKLSDRRLVHSFIDILSGIPPERPYVVKSEKFDTSMAVALVLDESQSMQTHKEDAAKMMLVLADTFHRLNIPFQCTGIRNSGFRTASLRESMVEEEDPTASKYHRYHNVIHDVYTRFDEDFRQVRWRFANTFAVGGTPLADGIQFGLDGLNYRDEAHRVLFVVTDGKPNIGVDVIPWQLRLAEETGIHIIGVGVDRGCHFVEQCFSHAIWDEDFSMIPRKILEKLNELVDIMALRRGRRMRTRIK